MKRQILLAVCLGVLSRAGLVHAIAFPSPWYVPFDRLIANTEAFIKDHPNDPQGYYTLARMHYFAFANQMPFVPTRNAESSPPNVAADWQVRAEGLPADLRRAEAEQHAYHNH